MFLRKLCFNFVIWFWFNFTANCYYQKQPKIISEDGELIIESALDRNITFRLTGQSCFLINDVNILDVIKPSQKTNGRNEADNDESIFSQLDSLRKEITGSHGLEERIRVLENGTNRRINSRLNVAQRQIRRLQSKVILIQRKLRENNCISAPCRNGGTCIDLYDDYFCICPNNWEGKTCDSDVDECMKFGNTELGCQNNAACINLPGTYRCECPSGWMGIHCSKREVDCSTGTSLEMCGHGTCIPESSRRGYKCICDQGWKTNGISPECIVDIDECAENKHHCSSSCINLPGSFTCAPCSNGYTGNGIRCSDINECEMNNGGCSLSPRVQCINTEGSYYCGSCPIGWSGDGRTCSKDETSDCSNTNICYPGSQCRVFSGMPICICPSGMTGNGYGSNGCAVLPNNTCVNNHCRNGGTCVVRGTNDSHAICVCPFGFTGENCENPDPCAINPCQNGGSCKVQTSPNRFKCLCRPGYEGRLCDQRSFLCGTTKRESSGVIKFPPTGSLYPPKERCAWVIRTNESLILNVTFTKFDLQTSDECRNDFLQIHDGRSVAFPLIGRFCGNILPKGGTFNSTHNQIYFWFSSDDRLEREGFIMSWNSTKPSCGGIIEIESHGTIQSPGYPGKAPPNRNCEWELRAPGDKLIYLTFVDIVFPNKTACEQDYLEILNDPVERQEIKTFCNTTFPQPFQSPSNVIVIHFHTDNSYFDSAFKIHYSLVEGISHCGGQFYGSSGGFESPTVNDVKDLTNTCRYIINAPEGSRIELTFPKFDLGPYSNCYQHSVEVYDGNTENSNIIGTWCGDQSPSPVESSSNQMLVKYNFRAFRSTIPFVQYGFHAKYKLACGGTYTEAPGVLISPLYPHKYPPGLTCVYTIQAPNGNAISLKFEDFELGNSYASCYDDDDHLAVYTLQMDEKYQYGIYCDSHPDKIISKYNVAIVKFFSNAAVLEQKERGFKISYNFEPIECGGVYNEQNGSITYSNTAFSAQDKFCEWIIIAPANNHILLEFDGLNIPSLDEECVDQALLIYSNRTSVGHLNGRYCGERKPPAATYGSNVLTIILKHHAMSTGQKFNANYKFIDISKTCGQKYISSTGNIRSPGYPEEYPQMLDCKWTISVPAGRQIKLTINRFVLEGGDCTKYDYLELRNGVQEDSPLIGRYCGEDIPKEIPSVGSNLLLIFRTDSSLEEMGFDIEWNEIGTQCGGTLQSLQGTILSPHYPDLITEVAQCDWRILISQGSRISVNFTIEPDTNWECNLYYLKFYNGLDPSIDPLPINCSNSLRRVKSNTNSMFIRYMTAAMGGIGSFILNYQLDCKVELTDFTGVIESPNFPNPYPNYLECRWTIVGRKGNTISLAFSHLDLELTDDTMCVYDNLKIIDIKEGIEQEVIEMCHHSKDVIKSKGETVTVEFITDSSRSSSGFRLEYAMNGCGDYLINKRGRLESPNSPYSLNTYCDWTIEAEYGYVVELQINEIILDTVKDCSKNALIISNDKEGLYPLMKICENQQTQHKIVSNGRMMYVQFYTDEENVKKSFKASYKITNTTCGGRVQAVEGLIYSPSYPFSYPIPSYCEWLITTEIHHTIDITFNYFELESCNNSYIEIYDGEHVYNSTLIDRICYSIPQGLRYESKSNKVLVIFKASYQDATKGGFVLHYLRNCGRKFIDESSGYFVKGFNDRDCIWTIQTSNNSAHITLHFSHVECDCEEADDENCEIYKGIAVYDGDSIKSPVKNKFCKGHPPPFIISNGQSLTIEGKSGYFEGYFSIYENSCGGKFRSIKGQFASPRYPNSYPTNVECEWVITARDGNYIEITFESLDIPGSEHCSEDYIEIRENNGGGRLIAFICNSNRSTTVTVFERAWIKFRSDDDIVGEGFLASWSNTYFNYINKTSGNLRPPPVNSVKNGPYNYRWQIEVPRGNVISMNFEEYSQGLKLYDGFDSTAPEIEIEHPRFQVTSNTNIVFLETDYRILNDFLLKWQSVSKEFNITQNLCSQQIIILPSNSFMNISSPGYPSGYDNDLDCEWILKSNNSGKHVRLVLHDVDLEILSDCSADFLTISSSENLIDWREERKLCTMDENAEEKNLFDGKPYLKINFHTDISINKTGFMITANTVCGGILTDSEGTLDGNDMKQTDRLRPNDCVWNIRLRPGRKIKFKILRMGIPDDSRGQCSSGYITIRDGFDEHAPYLGQAGQICAGVNYDLGKTLSNHALIKGHFTRSQDYDWAIHYEEISEECSYTKHLSAEDNSTEIATPNFPNIPNPYIQCDWIILAPPGHRLIVDFEGRFDLSTSSPCTMEYLEIRDGSTEISRKFGQYCMKPKPIRSSGNSLFFRYVTNIPEPGNGFHGIVKTLKCGGLAGQQDTEIRSENYPALGAYPSNSVCEYRIKVSSYFRLNLTFSDIHLPFTPNSNESDHLKLYLASNISDDDDQNNTEILTIYGNNTLQNFIAEDNEVLIKFFTFKPNSQYRGFRISFKRVLGKCGGEIRKESGTLQLPRNRRSLLYCQWTVIVPKGRSVMLTITNMQENTQERGMYNVLFFNDVGRSSEITKINTVKRISVQSTDNIMLVLYRGSPKKLAVLEMNFTSYQQSPCPGDLEEDTGIIRALSLNSSYYCKSSFTLSTEETMSFSIRDFIYTGSKSSYLAPISIRFTPLLIISLTQNINESLIAAPGKKGSIEFRQKLPNIIAGFTISYKKTRCGGIIQLGNGASFTIKLPEFFNITVDGAIECVWELQPKYSRHKFVMNGTLNLANKNCDQEYLSVYDSIKDIDKTKICSNSTTFNAIPHYGTLIHYHADTFNAETRFEIHITPQANCGGDFGDEFGLQFQTIEFTNSDYKNNLECVWTVNPIKGLTTEIVFYDRFYIQESNDCSKDYIEIKEYKKAEWIQIGRFCGRHKPDNLKITNNKFLIIFRSDESVTGDGFKIRFNQICGGVFEVTTSKEIIQYPEQWIYYGSKINCNYTLVTNTDTDEIIKVNFLKFDLDTNRRCPTARMSIYKPNYYNIYENELYGNFCLADSIKSVRGYNRIQLIISSLVYRKIPSYQFEFYKEVCGGTVNNSTEIRSPKDETDSTYPSNMNCVWNITAPEDKSISIYFKEFDFYGPSECEYDYVVIYSGHEIMESAKEAKFCSNLTGKEPIVQIKTNKALLHAKSDHSASGGGFVAMIEFTRKCDQTITLTAGSQLKTVQHYAKRNEKEDCHIQINAEDGYFIIVEFKNFNISNCSHTPNCECDYLEAREDAEQENVNVFAKFCGSTIPPPILSVHEKLLLRLVADGDATAGGFTAEVSMKKSVCGERIINLQKNEKAIIQSPNFGNGNYPPNTVCKWIINCNTTIELEFVKFDLEETEIQSDTCSDYLDIRITNGFTNEHDVLCGNKSVHNYYLNYAPMGAVLIFKSNSQAEKSGFKLIARESRTCNITYTTLSGNIQKEISNSECLFYISVPQNYTLSFHFRNMYISGSDECKTHFMKFYNARNEELLKSICEYSFERVNIFANTNFVKIHVKAEVESTYFDMTFIASNNGLGCGGDVQTSEGVISSPFYPQNIRNHTHCRWNIHTTTNKRLQLSFRDFDMGSKINCDNDYVQFVEIAKDGQEEVVRTFCGEDTPNYYLSRNNRLAVVYKRTVNFDGSGWFLRFFSVAV